MPGTETQLQPISTVHTPSLPRSRTSMSNETAKVLSDYILEEHAAVGEVGMGSLSRMDDAIGHDDFSTALIEASAAL